MKNIVLFLVFPFLTFAQIEKTIKLKVAVVQEIVKKGAQAETEFWQTKGKVTFAIKGALRRHTVSIVAV